MSVWKQSFSVCKLKLADIKHEWRRSVWRSAQNADSRHQTANRKQNGDCRNIKECLSVERAWNEYRWRIGEFLQGKAMRCLGLFSCYRIAIRCFSVTLIHLPWPCRLQTADLAEWVFEWKMADHVEWFNHKIKLGDRMIKRWLNSVIAKYHDLSVSRRSSFTQKLALLMRCEKI